jgi:hypothetical protein
VKLDPQIRPSGLRHHAADVIDPDALFAASDYHTLLFENSDVRVLDVHLPPHIREPMHTYPWPGVLYVLQGVPTRYHTPALSDPPVQNPPFPSFKLLPVPAEGLHALENTGDIGAHAIRFELKHATPVSQ